jgi:hypothetical protein
VTDNLSTGSEHLPELEAEIVRVTTADPAESRQSIKTALKKFKVEADDEFLSQSQLKVNEATIRLVSLILQVLLQNMMRLPLTSCGYSAVFKDAVSVEAIMTSLSQLADKGNDFSKATHEVCE